VKAIHLGPRASLTVDIGMLLTEHEPDVNGNLIPAYIQGGSVTYASPKGKTAWMTLAVCGAFYNPHKGTCGMYWTYCYGYSNPQVQPSPFSVAMGDTVRLTAYATYADGSQQAVGASWQSSDTSVAAVGSNGVVAAVAAGSVGINAYYYPLVVYTGELCSYGNPVPCPTGQLGGGSNGTVVDATPVITGIDPSVWTPGQMTQVTITGLYFGTNAPTLGFSPSSGISYALSSYSDTQIVAMITVAAGTPNEEVGVTVTNNGYGGSGFTGGQAGQSASSAPAYARVNAPLGSPEITVVGWINGNAPDLNPLPGGANSTLVNNLTPGTTSCGEVVAAWYLGVRVDLNSSADVTYANAWLVKHSANTPPPNPIAPYSYEQTLTNFRLFNDFGGAGGGTGSYAIGITPDPCGLGITPGWVGQGQRSPYSGPGISPSGEICQLAEGRIGSVGQRVSNTINGRTVPWVWSAIEFDSNGNPTYSNVAIFPTYSVYRNGQLVATYNQSSVATFVAKDETYQLTPSQIP
jgi:hypothetical protein